MELGIYTPEHRLELEQLLSSPAWQRIMGSDIIEEVKAERIEPNPTRNFIGTVVDQLFEFNEERVKKLIAEGNEDEDYLLSELGKWPDSLDNNDPIISFFGLNVTPECNFNPKCVYCNQPWVEQRVDIEGWKRVIAEVTEGAGEQGPYIYITGGEPLLLQEQIWGDDGLIRFATERGAGINLNTNAAMITPEVALYFIKSGLARLHISLDTYDRDTQNFLANGERFDQIMEGIYNVQLARDIVGSAYPIIHTNCVLTNRNLEHFPKLFAFVLEKHKQTADRSDPFCNDLFTHVVPVGGKENSWLRPSEEEFRRFYEEMWPEVCEMWDTYQGEMGVPKDKRGALFGYFSNPALRVKHQGGLDEYVKASAEGFYGKLALSKRCYVAPTQAAITPDGNQYMCGSHAIRHLLPIGNILESGVFDNIRASTCGALNEVPQESYCSGCALATLYINQAVESKLMEKILNYPDEADDKEAPLKEAM